MPTKSFTADVILEELEFHTCKQMPDWVSIYYNDFDEAILTTSNPLWDRQNVRMTVNYCPYCGEKMPRIKTYEEAYFKKTKRRYD